jgi:hypothetical protein
MTEEFNLQFFGAEAATAPAEGTQQTQTDAKRDPDEIRNEEFDRKSPLLGGGSYDPDEDDAGDEGDEDDRGGDGSTAGGEEAPSGETEPEKQPSQELTPFKVLKIGGRDVPIPTESDYERMAAAGLQSEVMRRRLAPFVPIIGAMERDPELARKVGEIIAAQQRGDVPTQEPKAEEEPPEPVQKDDESFDAFEKRKADWREDRQKRLVDRRIRETLETQERATRQARLGEFQRSVVEHVQQDPHKGEVLDVLLSPSIPQSLRTTIDADPAAFMVVYDTVSRLQGREGYFGAPVFGGGGNSATMQQGKTPPATPGSGRTMLKEKKTVPFSERPGATNGGGGSGLPDFKGMSDEDFDKYVEQQKNKGF